MKTIKVFFLVLLSIISFAFYSSSFARDYVSWNNLKMTSSYNEYQKELKLRFVVDEYTVPSDTYYLTYTINGFKYSKQLNYDYSAKQLYLDTYVGISNYNSTSSYNIYAEIYNYNDNKLEYSNNFTAYVNTKLDWTNTKVETNYNYSSNYLTVKVYLDDVYTYPSNTNYYSYLKVNWNTYSKNFSYSSSDRKYYATHEIYINRDSYWKDYNYTVSIKDNSYSSTLYETQRYIYLNWTNSNSSWNYYYDRYNNWYYYTDDYYNNYYNNDNYCRKNSDYYYTYEDCYDSYYRWGYRNDNINWESNTKITTSYNKNTWVLYVNFFINTNWKPANSYYVKLNFNWTNYSKKLDFTSSLAQLSASFSFNIPNTSVKDYYYISYSVTNSYDNYVEFVKSIFKLNVDTWLSSISSTSTDNLENSLADQTAQSLIKKWEKNYTKSADRINFLERSITSLNTYANSNPSYKDFTNNVNKILREQINKYKSSPSSDSSDIFKFLDWLK